MGPPLSWLYSQTDRQSDYIYKSVAKIYDSCRAISVNFTFALIFVQFMLSFQYVGAGPVVFNMEYSQGPVPLARNIRHLPCISRRSGQEGLCMFAIDCLKANGTHLGTCIDRFYFGSCCQIPDKTILPIITNHIDDNSIDGASFVHPQTDKINFEFRKTTTEKAVTKTEAETKSDVTTIDNKIEKVTSDPKVTEVPVKLSTFQTVSAEVSNTVTEKVETERITEAITISSTQTTPVTLKPKPTRKPTRPSSFTRPTYKPYNITRPQYTQSTYKPKPTKPVINTTRKPPYRPPPKRPSTKKPLPIPPRLNITILPQSTSSKPLFTRPQSVITYINTTNVKDEPNEITTAKEVVTTEKIVVSTEKLTTMERAPTTEKLTTTEKVTTPEIIVTTEKVATTEKLPTTEKIPETDPTTIFIEPATEKVEKTTEAIKTTEEMHETTLEVAEKETVRPVTEADIPEPEVTTTSTEYPPFATWSSNSDATKMPERVTEAPTTTTEETWSPITPPEGWILLSTIAPKPETTVSNPETNQTPTENVETQPTETEPSSIETEPTTQSNKITTFTSLTEFSIPTTTKVTTTKVPTNEEEATVKVTESPSTKVTESPSTIVTEAPSNIVTEAPTVKVTESPTVKVTESPTVKVTEPTTTIVTSSTTVSTPSTATTEGTTTKVEEKVPEVTKPLQEFTVNVTLSPTVPTTTVSSVSNDTKGNETSTEGNLAMETTTNATTTVETTTEFINMSDYKNVCGRRLWQAPTGRIVGGQKSGFGMWPWQISLRQYRTSTYLHKCGAALLNENWAITAAHCVEHVPPSELLVRLGEHDLANEDEPYGFAERRVQIVASHPHFDPATFEYDLALLRFYEPVTFQPNILPVCVPDNDDDYVGRSAYVTGWGRLFDEGPLPSVLQEVMVPVINNSACEAMYQAAGYNEHIPNIFICAGRSKGGTDSCEGDSGGPMVLPRERDGRYVLGGVISWGIGCAEPNQPGVYTRISEFRDWINQILQF